MLRKKPKPFIRVIIFFVFIIPVWHCAPTHSPSVSIQNNAGIFQLVNAQYEQSVSGYNGTKSTEYFFTVAVKTTKELRFDSAWIDNKRYPLSVSGKRSIVSNSPVEVKAGDTIILRATDLHAGTSNEIAKAPINYNGRALIRFIEGSKVNYFEIKEIILNSVPNRQ